MEKFELVLVVISLIAGISLIVAGLATGDITFIKVSAIPGCVILDILLGNAYTL